MHGTINPRLIEGKLPACCLKSMKSMAKHKLTQRTRQPFFPDASSAYTEQEPDPLADFTALLTHEISLLNGSVVPKLNWSTPKVTSPSTDTF